MVVRFWLWFLQLFVNFRIVLLSKLLWMPLLRLGGLLLLLVIIILLV